MTALIVILCILIFFWLIGMLRANLILVYNGELSLKLRVLFVTVPLVPGRNKKLNPDAYSPKGYRKMLAKEAKKQAKKEKKAELKAQKKKQQEEEKKRAARRKKTAKGSQKQSAPASKKRMEVADIVDLVLQILEAVKGLGKSFGKHFRIEAVKLKLTVATGDAAETAILYGVVCQGVAYLIEILSAITNFRAAHRENISVDADFLADKSTADVHMIFRIRVWHVLAMLFSAGCGFIRKRFFAPSPRENES